MCASKKRASSCPLSGEKTPAIEFSSDFTGKLQAANNGTVKNTFTLNYVQANNRKNKEGQPVAYTINVHKPEFNIQVQPGNVWSKEFTIDPVEVAEGKGDAAIIADNLTYQYQDENGNWQGMQRCQPASIYLPSRQEDLQSKGFVQGRYHLQ